MAVKPELVLDKSFLRAVSPTYVAELCREYRVIMPGALLFELLTGDEATRTECFGRLPAGHNPVEIVEHVGKLLQYEARRNGPCPSLAEVRTVMLYRFNAKLADGSFTLNPQQKAALAEWSNELAEDVRLHKQMSAATHNWFAELQTATPATMASAVARARERVLDVKFVRRRYGSITRPSFPRKDLVDRRWTFFRWTQVHLLAALEYIRRYGIGNPNVDAKRLENDVVDMQYQVMALLAGRIATRDQGMRAGVLALRPDMETFQ